MEDINQKIKKLRKEVFKTFLLLFIPHSIVILSLLNSQVTTNPIDTLKWQLCWFVTYFSISLLVYIFAPKITKKR